jgi:hypothetical protein
VKAYSAAGAFDAGWPELLQHPAPGNHFVQLYQDEAFLCDAAAQYIGTALRHDEGAIIIATDAHRDAFLRRLDAEALHPAQALAAEQLVLLDAGETLDRCTVGGLPEWQSFHALIGGTIAQMRLAWPAVRAYGEMVDVLWQRGQRDAAVRLEEFWNDLAKLQTFSLLCSYRMDPLGAAAYEGPLECVCKVHTHLIPALDYRAFNAAVLDACQEVFEQPLASALRSAAADHHPAAAMPEGQATLLWLKRNMPRSAERILAGVRLRLATSSPEPGASPALRGPSSTPRRA